MDGPKWTERSKTLGREDLHRVGEGRSIRRWMLTGGGSMRHELRRRARCFPLAVPALLLASVYGCGNLVDPTDPEITLSPPTAEVEQGGQLSVVATIRGMRGPYGIELSLEGTPPSGLTGVVAHLEMTTALDGTARASALVLIDVDDTLATGRYDIEVAARASAVDVAFATFTLLVTPVPN